MTAIPVTAATDPDKLLDEFVVELDGELSFLFDGFADLVGLDHDAAAKHLAALHASTVQRTRILAVLARHLENTLEVHKRIAALRKSRALDGIPTWDAGGF